MKKLIMLLGAICALSLNSGCALLFMDDKEQVRVDSNPTNADVYVEGKYVGKTPIDLTYPRFPAPLVVIAAEGYQPTQLRIARQMNIAAGIDAALSFCLPIIAIDFIDMGKMVRYKENDVCCPLIPADSTSGKFAMENFTATKYTKPLNSPRR